MTTAYGPLNVTGSCLPKNNIHLRDHIYFLFRSLQRGIRPDENWKLILFKVNGVDFTQLLNLNEDPNELTNLTGDKKYNNKLKNCYCNRI